MPTQSEELSPSILLSKPAMVALLFAPALLDLFLSYAYLVYLFGGFPLWRTIIHEQGTRNFWQTIFFNEHVLRELPLNTIYALAIAGFARWCGVRPSDPHLCRGRFSLRSVAGVYLGVLVMWVLAATFFDLGARGVWVNLSQWKIDDKTFGYGFHWHFHWTGMIAVIFAAGGTVTAALGLLGRTRFGGPAGLLVWLAAFIGLTVIFGFSWKTFNDPRYLGHQVREVVTFVPLAVLPTVAFLIILNRNGSPPKPGRLWTVPCITLWGLFVGTMGVLLIPLWGISVLNHAARPNLGLLYLIASHNFEHLLGYLYIIALTMLLALEPRYKVSTAGQNRAWPRAFSRLAWARRFGKNEPLALAV